MPVKGDIQDQAHQIFFQEALELLKGIREGLLGVFQDPSSAKIDSLVRAAYDLKGGAAYLNLADIETLASRLKDIFQSLRRQQSEFDAELVNLLLQAYACLQHPLSAQIETGQYDGAAILASAHPTFAQLEARLGLAFPNGEDQLTDAEPSGRGAGISSTAEMSQLLDRLETVLTHSQVNQLPVALNAQADAMVRIAERLGLIEFITVAQTMRAGLKANPYAAQTIGKLALAGLRAAQATVLKSHQDHLETIDTQDPTPVGVEQTLINLSNLELEIIDIEGPRRQSRVERTLKTTRSFVWMAGSIICFLPYTSIEAHVAPKTDQIIQSRNQQFLHWQDHMIPLYSLSNLLKSTLLPKIPSGKIDSGATPTLVIRQGRRVVALKSAINRLITQPELVIQSLNQSDASPDCLCGYTRLASDDWGAVIDVRILLNQMIGIPDNPVVSASTTSLNSPNAKLSGQSVTRTFEQN